VVSLSFPTDPPDYSDSDDTSSSGGNCRYRSFSVWGPLSLRRPSESVTSDWSNGAISLSTSCDSGDTTRGQRCGSEGCLEIRFDSPEAGSFEMIPPCPFDEIREAGSFEMIPPCPFDEIRCSEPARNPAPPPRRVPTTRGAGCFGVAVPRVPSFWLKLCGLRQSKASRFNLQSPQRSQGAPGDRTRFLPASPSRELRDPRPRSPVVRLGWQKLDTSPADSGNPSTIAK